MTVAADDYPRTDQDCAPFVRALGLPGYLDVHVHLLPDRLQRAVWAYFDGLTDPPWPVTYRVDEDERLRLLRSFGVVAHTALAYAHKPGMLRWLNTHTLDAADRLPQVIPTFTFHAEEDAAAEVAHAIGRGGRLAKVHLQVGRFDTVDPRLDEVWPQLVAAGVPALIHAGAGYGVDGGEAWCGPDAIRRLLDRFPDVTVIVAHLGIPDAAGFLALAEQAPRVHLDVSMALTDPPYGPPYPPELLVRLAALAREGKVLFGSDFPTIPHPFAAQVRGLAALRLDEAALRLVLHDAAADLLGRPPRDPAAPARA